MENKKARLRTAALPLACAVGVLVPAAPACAAEALGAGMALDVPWTRLALRPDPRVHRSIAPAGVASLQAGAVIPVTNCADDGGFDELRHAVLTADAGDTIDLSGAACAAIVLQGGPIVVGVNDLKIAGPAGRVLTIDGNGAGLVFDHQGTGTLELDDLTIAHGTNARAKAYGGCIYSKGSVTLARSTVSSCTAQGADIAAGGAVLTLGNLTMRSSTLSGNVAQAPGADKAIGAAGGAAFVIGVLDMRSSVVSGNVAESMTGLTYAGAFVCATCNVKYSTISANSATSAGTVDNHSIGGGIFGSSNMTVYRTTIDNNSADLAGGVYIAKNGTTTANFLQVTISGNHGLLAVGAIEANSNVAMSNSTVAFNDGGSFGNVGVLIVDPATATLNSTIVADNTAIDIAGGGMIAGAHDLVKIVGANAMLPAGTIGLDPKLGPLGLHGGATRTHVPAPGSPAIDAGSDAAAFAVDQRGPSYRRIVGAAADIGAVETDPDHIFGSGLGDP